MYSNLLQWRQIRKKILVDGKSIQSISKSSGISRNTIRKILKTESPPGYGGQKTQKEKKHSSIKTVKISKTELDQIRWQEWIYEIERGNFRWSSTKPLYSCISSFNQTLPALVQPSRVDREF